MTASSTPTSLIAPLAKTDRILFIDALRGFAVLGILIMNITAQGQSHDFYDILDISKPVTGPNFYAWLMECMVFEGTMRGMFSLLFGAGSMLLLERLTRTRPGLEAADIYYRRLLWLLLFGLVNAYVFLWPGDILYAYSICGLFLFPFRNMSSKGLILIAVLLLAFGTYRGNSDLFAQKAIINKGQAILAVDTSSTKLTDAQRGDLQAYIQFRETHSREAVNKSGREAEAAVRAADGYPAMFNMYKDVNAMLESSYLYKFYWFDVLTMFFLGMALFKNGFLLGKSPTWVYLLIAIVGIGVGAALSFYSLRAQYRLRFDLFLYVQERAFSHYEIRRVLQTLGYLSLLILGYKWLPFRKLFGILTPVGQMAFTNYLSQSIITSVIFYGFNLYGTFERYQLYYFVAGIWIFQIIFSHVWMRYFLFGPFEWLWRSLTYRRRQPMLRTKMGD